MKLKAGLKLIKQNQCCLLKWTKQCNTAASALHVVWVGQSWHIKWTLSIQCAIFSPKALQIKLGHIGGGEREGERDWSRQREREKQTAARSSLFIACPTNRQHVAAKQTKTFFCQINILHVGEVDQEQCSWVTIAAKPSHKGVTQKQKLYFCVFLYRKELWHMSRGSTQNKHHIRSLSWGGRLKKSKGF